MIKLSLLQIENLSKTQVERQRNLSYIINEDRNQIIYIE